MFSNDLNIVLDGRLDEPVWQTAKEYSGFKTMKSGGAQPIPVATSFRILSDKDCVYFGVRFDEPNMEQVRINMSKLSIWGSDHIELFISPSGDSFEFYQFLISINGESVCNFYSEGGNIKPDRYAPEWHSAVYLGEDYWSVEIAFPLTAFYMTPNSAWSDKWKLNVCRVRPSVESKSARFYTWSDLVTKFLEPENFREVDGFPVRPAEDDVCICSAAVSISAKDESAYLGTVSVKINNPAETDYVFSSDCTEEKEITLQTGMNTISLPCRFAEEGRQSIALQLTRKADGKVFKRWSPVRVTYQPIKLTLTLPEYRGNFYPGQDYSKVVGRVEAEKPVTITLEGPGIGTKTAVPDCDGNFTIDTADFEIGEAMLTITDSVNTVTKKIRHLAPSEHMMTWISGGNLIVDGKPTIRRNLYGEHYHGGVAFNREFDNDNYHNTPMIRCQKNFITPSRLMKGCDAPGGEATKDIRPCDEMFEKVAAVMDADKDRDFGYYYLEDEPECRNISPVYLKYLYDFIADRDPYHVILMASRGAGDYIECTDWVETHAYINPEVRDGVRDYGRPINTLASYVESVAKQNRSDKCVGFMPTCFAYQYQSVFSDYPTFDEMICHTWAAMLGGGKTLWSYAYHDMNDRAELREGTRYVFSSFEALEELVLLAKRTELVHTKDVYSVLYELQDEKMFVLVNMTQQPQQVTLDGVSGTWHHFRHGEMISGNTFELKPHEVIIGTTSVKDAGMPTYQETVALIAKQEYDRTHGGSLLFNRHRDITVTATVPSSKYKLFDGIRNNYGWECVKKEKKFYEMNLSKIMPTFTKVVVNGFQIDDMEIKIRVGEELVVPAIAKKETEEFTTTFILEKPICTDVLRLEFGERIVELYEIELF